jgi:hypothetical protein
MERCQMFAGCSAAKHIAAKCLLHQPHEEHKDHQRGFPCPLGVVYGADSRVKCFVCSTPTHKEEES